MAIWKDEICFVGALHHKEMLGTRLGALEPRKLLRCDAISEKFIPLTNILP